MREKFTYTGGITFLTAPGRNSAAGRRTWSVGEGFPKRRLLADRFTCPARILEGLPMGAAASIAAKGARAARASVCGASLTITFLATGVVPGLAASQVPEEPPALSQDIYIWQRAWTPHLGQSVRENGQAFGILDVLAAELSSGSRTPRASYTKPDWSALVASGRRIGIVVRSGPAPIAEGGSGPAAADLLIGVCTQALAQSRAGGVDPVELQLDLDAATGSLPAYRVLLHRLRDSVRPVALVVTVLPDWLRSPEFAPLVSEAGSYVLQVHSLERPQVREKPFTLCDPARAERWIGEASRLGIPFRVALPTYGYRVSFGADGRFFGIQAEGPARAWPAGGSVRTVMADPDSIAALVRRLSETRPGVCMGIVWFRMPSEDDQLAWRWKTLRRVMSGEVPRGHLVLRAPETADGLVDLAVLNDGEAQVSVSAFDVSWRGACLIASDGISGWRVERNSRGGLTLDPPAWDDSPLFPGERREIGWMRLSAPAHIEGTPSP
jgi:hypothetical protein